MEVNIKTKFNVGDIALRFNPSTNKLEEFEIDHISIYVSDKVVSIGYCTVDYGSHTTENNLFASKEEFINQL